MFQDLSMHFNESRPGWLGYFEDTSPGTVRYSSEANQLSFIAWNNPGELGLSICKSCKSHFLINRLPGDLLLSEACWQCAIHWKTSGKSLKITDARFIKSLTISFRGSSSRVRPKCLPLEDSNCFAKRQVNTPQSVSFLCFGH